MMHASINFIWMQFTPVLYTSCQQGLDDLVLSVSVFQGKKHYLKPGLCLFWKTKEFILKNPTENA